MLTGSKKLMVVAGETSGDERAAELVHALRDRHCKELSAFGMGGGALQSAGVDLVADISSTAVVGVSEALAAASKLKRIMLALEQRWLDEKPDAALLVDYGGFNLRLARRLKRHGARVVYYISPQVWASRPGRIRWIKRYVDLMLVLFSFEEEIYREKVVNAVHVGHPLLDSIKVVTEKDAFLHGLEYRPDKCTIGFMPGSRAKEIERLLEPMLDAADILFSRGHKQQFIIAAPGVTEKIKDRIRGRSIDLIEGDRYSAMASADLLVMASGTAALEAAILGVPSIVVYKTSLLTYIAAKLLMRVKSLALPNIILGDQVFPELLQGRCRAEKIAAEAALILEDSVRYDRIRAQLTEVVEALGEKGAAQRAADHLARFLEME